MKKELGMSQYVEENPKRKRSCNNYQEKTTQEVQPMKHHVLLIVALYSWLSSSETAKRLRLPSFKLQTMSATATIVSFSSLSSLCAKLKDQGAALLPYPNYLKPNLTLKYPRLGISHTTRKATNHVFPVVVSCLVNDNSETHPELEEAPVSDESIAGATIDLKLPRRSLLVQFTCDACGERSKRLINRLAYEKGTVYLQCSGCSLYHKLVDNLSLVVEYDLREENSTSSDTDQA